MNGQVKSRYNEIKNKITSLDQDVYNLQNPPLNVFKMQVNDHSVNAAKVHINNDVLSLECSIRTNTAGNFNGGGTGNKAIASLFSTIDNTLLSNFPTLEYKFQLPVGSTLANAHAYINVIVDINGNGSSYKIMALMFKGDTAPLDNTETRIDLGSGKYHVSFNKAINNVGVVGAPLAGVIPVVGDDIVAWGLRRYTISSIIAAYPNAKIVSAISGDGGMPKFTKTASILLCHGDSATNSRQYVEISEVKVNDIPVIFTY